MASATAAGGGGGGGGAEAGGAGDDRKHPHYQAAEDAAVAKCAIEASRDLGESNLKALNKEVARKYPAALDVICATYPFQTLKSARFRLSKRKSSASCERP